MPQASQDGANSSLNVNSSDIDAPNSRISVLAKRLGETGGSKNHGKIVKTSGRRLSLIEKIYKLKLL